MNAISSEQLAALWVQAQPAVAAYVSSLIPDFHDANDVLQNVAMVTVRKREEYDADRPFAAWAIRIAQLEVLKQRRDYARGKLKFSDELVASLGATYEEVSPQLDNRRQGLGECLKKVQGTAERLLNLRYAQGLSIAEVANQTDSSAETVRTTLYRARKSLHDCVERFVRRMEET